MKYFIDTCVWRDYYEDRFSKSGRPIGEYAGKLFIKMINNRHKILITEEVIRELLIDYNENEIKNMFNFLFLTEILEKVQTNKEDYKVSKQISIRRQLPHKDALYAIIASKHNAILISRDKHMFLLRDIVRVKRPEEIH